MGLRTIIAEGDEVLRRSLIKELEQIEGVEVIYSTDSGKDLLNSLRLMKPQIAIIDTHMRDINGIKIAGAIREEQPSLELIFISPSTEYLRDAIRLYAVDFMEKPIDSKRLHSTICRIKYKFNVIEKAVQLRAEGGYQIVKKNDIYLIEAVDKKSKIYTSSESFICDHSLKEMEELLTCDNFFRASRSNIINLEKIKQIVPYTRTSFEVVFTNKNIRGYLSKRMHSSYQEKIKALVE